MFFGLFFSVEYVRTKLDGAGTSRVHDVGVVLVPEKELDDFLNCCHGFVLFV